MTPARGHAFVKTRGRIRSHRIAAGDASELLPVGASYPSAADFRHTKLKALSRLDRIRHFGVALLWIAVNVTFWRWWKRQTAYGTPWLFWIETVMLAYQTTFLPTVFWWFVGRMKRPVEVEAPAGLRVAVISRCVPASESLEVIREQLRALVDVNYPHDS